MNNDAISLLQSPETIRERSQQLFDRVKNNESPYFRLDLSRLDEVTKQLTSLINDYPSIEAIPFHSRWRHFEVAGIDRIASLKRSDDYPTDPLLQGRKLFELVIISVLLDAGAGETWTYYEKDSGKHYSRSEGLAVASFDMYRAGLFFDNTRHCVTAKSLAALSLDSLKQGFQVTESNPMTALDGRLSLLHTLSDVLASNQLIFGAEGELGLFYDFVIEKAGADNKLDAADILKAVLNCFSPIWPGRVEIDGVNLGDVWQHTSIRANDATEGLIPFHKLSQWLSYSLLEPLSEHGYEIYQLESLTGLPEYRNGGLFLDSGVITLKDDALREADHPANSELIIEWRALTICLLDLLWQRLLSTLSLDKEAFPLVKMLEAGSWKAGRLLAYQKRDNGAPPLNLLSDGTVF
jgi:hypothetical protein